ncbi:MAG: hypothetical protein ACOCX2_08205, partial [Armatimonadota bacterium]
MRKTALLSTAALLAAVIPATLLCAAPSVQQWSVRGTAPVTVTLPVADAPRQAWVRAADGSWAELSPRADDGRLHVELTPEHLAGGSVLIVLDPPGWLSLDDAGPPAVESFS